ncbi:BAG molecular chaperone regulator 2 [Dermatophagoides pteronyssinus]|uniref:Uncharacterized protein LOC113793383 n=2 Tax=Dermatophagoides pteronyssinus TaxID=6956 RepID=A0A6P6Y1S2_DERPT|nr:uncharacterized protein LOC113793383 [Dermatophagoides pteronyssinus]XP_027199210.1 uncharacterized protein LOC113793383 [Dermatophagoides pteronyssinus]KAH9426893.1 BAG molecular chaperone regulator 2 [Dermatophagoides pteronyssinus]
MEILRNDGSGTPTITSIHSKLPPNNSSATRKSIIKISSEQKDKNPCALNNERTRTIPIFRSISHNVENESSVPRTSRSPSYKTPNFNYQSPFNPRINLRISSPDPTLSRMLSRINSLTQSSNERCHSPMSSGYDSSYSSTTSTNPNHYNHTPEIRLQDIHRSSSANRLYSGKQYPNNFDGETTSSSSSFDINKHKIKTQTTAPTITIKQRQRFSLNDQNVPIMKDDVLKTLDQVEKRIVFLREIAFELSEEKNKLFDALNKIATKSPASNFSSFTEVDLQDIHATTEDLLQRLESVKIIIKPMRSSIQIEAFENAIKYIDTLKKILMQEGRIAAKKKCLTYLSSCTSDDSVDKNHCELFVPIDERFQKIVIDCSLDDQKTIKKELEHFLEKIEKK